jgi:hypothetical protein
MAHVNAGNGKPLTDLKKNASGMYRAELSSYTGGNGDSIRKIFILLHAGNTWEHVVLKGYSKVSVRPPKLSGAADRFRRPGTIVWIAPTCGPVTMKVFGKHAPCGA